MKQAVGGTWTLQLIILFILLFVGYIVLTLNYSKTIKIKNETVSIIEKYNGINKSSLTNINNYLASSNYDGSGICYNSRSDNSNLGIYGVDSLDINNPYVEEAQNGKRYFYCIKKYKGTGKTSYYQMTLFYKFNLPIIGSFSNFTVKGSTGNFQSGDNYRSVGI